jgi:hypothetical protein
MIPYEELVIALQTWRAKQGLPVAQMSGQLTPPPIAQSTPPAPPPRAAQPFLGNVATPPPLAAETHEESLDVDGALIEETHYENEGDDFAMAFGQSGASEEDAPERPTEANLEEGTEIASPGARRGGNPREEW